MPYDCGNDKACFPTAEEYEALENWLLKAAMQENLEPSRDTITMETEIELALSDLNSLPTHRHSDIRYLSLRVQHNDTKLNSKSLDEHKAALLKTLNVLSTNAAIFKHIKVDPYQILVRVQLPELGWSSKTWQLLEEVYPYGVSSQVDTALANLQRQTHTGVPIIRADWLAATATVSPLYYDVLGLPDSFQFLEKTLGVDSFSNIKNGQVARAGFQKSGVSANNRLIERHDLGTGFFWTSYDFAGNKSRQNLFNFPLGPIGALESYLAFEHDGGETIFTLPNGFHGYYLNTVDGKRLNVGPTDIVRDTNYRQGTGEVVNGISCISCHVEGMRAGEDKVRESANDNLTFSASDRQRISEIYPGAEQVNALIAQDKKAFLAVLDQAGVGRETRLNGREPIRGLFVYHLDNRVDLTRAAAELGMTEKALLASAAFIGLDLAGAFRRLEQSPLARDEWDDIFPVFLERLTDYKSLKHKKYLVDGEQAQAASLTYSNSPAKEVKVLLEPATLGTKEENIAMYSDKNVYKKGESITLLIEPRQDCSLTLINVSPKGEMCVLFPHPALDNSPIKAGQQFTYPPRGQMTGEIVGIETFQAFCNTSETALKRETRHLPETSCFVNADEGVRTKAKSYLEYEVSVDLDASTTGNTAATNHGQSKLKKAVLKLEVRP